jgi:hypothetical protein
MNWNRIAFFECGIEFSTKQFPAAVSSRGACALAMSLAGIPQLLIFFPNLELPAVTLLKSAI